MEALCPKPWEELGWVHTEQEAMWATVQVWTQRRKDSLALLEKEARFESVSAHTLNIIS
jgi:hypothetical protein